MLEDLLNQLTGAVNKETDRHTEAPRRTSDRPTDGAQTPDEAGTEETTELLARQADTIRAQALSHSTEEFMQRLAARIATEARQPARVQYASAVPAADALHPEEAAEITQLAPPTAGPLARTDRPVGRPHTRPRRRRRRPTPINPSDAKASQALAFGYVTELCSTVLQSQEIDTLSAFAADYDEAGARTFGCLLYSLDKRESATYWWRFAAGAGDALAAHLLAAHHAAIGPTADSRVWRAFARMLGFSPEQHVPQPVRHRTELAPGFARELPLRHETRLFLRYPHVPDALVAR
ncbi:hypothetical protein EAO73_35115 [Streptomyces sp. col6]|uniref:hypothetical protein n=1 Tax=Streptomyces sp. col6 TaxID=2478958 RepID=UPI0011CE0D46|nr:hypothetical protein [Streptomyces sp. col6]TXR94513.1 hypothetical protein EAO73_35115 [Streptomyces sp. col6]